MLVLLQGQNGLCEHPVASAQHHARPASRGQGAVVKAAHEVSTASCVRPGVPGPTVILHKQRAEAVLGS